MYVNCRKHSCIALFSIISDPEGFLQLFLGQETTVGRSILFPGSGTAGEIFVTYGYSAGTCFQRRDTALSVPFYGFSAWTWG